MSRVAVRKFGVELEGIISKIRSEDNCIQINGETWLKTIESSIDTSLEETKTCNICDGLGYHANCKYCDNGLQYVEAYGREFISPPTRNISSIATMYRILNQELDWKVNDTCGFHIHVDAAGFDNKGLYRLLLLMTAIEPIIVSLNDEYRYYTSEFSYPLNEKSFAVNKILSQPYDDINDINFIDSRFSSLNYYTINRHGTIEFRYFSPQISAEPVMNFVELVTKIVDFVLHASYEELLPVYNRLMDCLDFSDACDTLVKVLDLSFDIKGMKKNNLYSRYEKIKPVLVAQAG